MPNMRHLTVDDFDCDAMVARIEAIESQGNVNDVSNRVSAIESWKNSPEDYIGSPLKVDYNPITTLLGALVGAMNTTNVKVNKIQTVLINKGLIAPS